MKNKYYIADIFCFLLITMWIYAAGIKLLSFAHYKLQMTLQAMPSDWIPFVTYFLPPAEIITAILIIVPKYRVWGLVSSAILMTAFTVYVSLAVFRVFPRRPCSCGGILEHMNWNGHLYFNLAFLMMTLTAIYMDKKKEGETAY